MHKLQLEVTKLYQILLDRGMTQKDLFDLIKHSNNGKTVPMYIINGIVNGNKENYTINTAKLIAKALNVKLDDIVENE